jgi:hypothetical protein
VAKLKTTEKCPYCGKPSKVWTEIKQLRTENANLRYLLRKHGIAFTPPEDQTVGMVGHKNESQLGKM